MEKNIIAFILFILIFPFSSCQKNDNKIEIEILKNQINKLKSLQALKDEEWIVILPGLGCGGCIQEGEAFMMNYVGNKNILFVLTDITSLKILEQKIKTKIKEHSNIYIDSNNEFKIPTRNSIYPCIVQIKDNNLITYEFQSPQNGFAFKKLKGLIKTN